MSVSGSKFEGLYVQNQTEVCRLYLCSLHAVVNNFIDFYMEVNKTVGCFAFSLVSVTQNGPVYLLHSLQICNKSVSIPLLTL